MKLLTTSSANSYRACNRLYQIRYSLGYKPKGERAHSLHFGTLWHGMLEVWWADRDIGAAVSWLDAQSGVDPYDRQALIVLLHGYALRWVDDGFEAITVEQEFRAPLLNPETGAPSRTFQLAGKKDLVARNAEGSWLIEHKTSSEDIKPGSTYWQRLRIDSQVSNYFVGSRANGHDIIGCIYDVVGKPGIKPLRATPEESRKYKKDGTLYAAQRDRDETPEEYGARLADDVGEKPEKYFQRGEVYRLGSEEREAARDMWHTARAIRDAERLDSWPRNGHACFRWSRQCDYWEVCTGQAQLTDERLFEQHRPHEELSKTEEVGNGSDSSNGQQRATSEAKADDACVGF